MRHPQGSPAVRCRRSRWKGGLKGWLCVIILPLVGCSHSSPAVDKSVGGPAARAVPSNPGGGLEVGAGGLGAALQQLAGELIGERSESSVNNTDKRPALQIKPGDGAASDGEARRAKATATPETARGDQYGAHTAECQRAGDDFRLARDAKDTEDSIFYYRRGLRLCPNEETARNELGELYLKIRQYDDAAQEFRRVLEINPESARGRSNLEAARSPK